MNLKPRTTMNFLNWNLPAAGKQTKLNMIARIGHVPHFRTNSVYFKILTIKRKSWRNKHDFRMDSYLSSWKSSISVCSSVQYIFIPENYTLVCLNWETSCLLHPIFSGAFIGGRSLFIRGANLEK